MPYPELVMRWLLVVTLGCLASLVASTRVSACSCASPTLSRQVLPADGATEVPTDASIRVFLHGFPEVARHALAGEYRLRDAAGALVALRAELVRTRLDLHPVDRLAPSTAYVLEQLFAYDDEGTLLTDDERARPGDALRAAWFPVARFTTAAGPAPSRLLTPDLDEVFLAVLNGGGDCGPATSLYVDLGARAGALPTDLVELRVAGQGVVATAPLDGLDTISAGDTLCTLDPITLRPGASIAFEVTFLDLSGRTLGRARRRARARTRRPASDRSESWFGSSSWRPVEVVPTPASSTTAAPRLCPLGLEGRDSTLVARGEYAHWWHGLVWVASSGGRWLFASGSTSRTLRGFSWVRGSPRAHDLPFEAQIHAGHATPAGPLVVTTPHQSESGTTVILPGAPPPPAPVPSLLAFTPRLRVRWTRELPRGDTHSFAHGDGRVVVAWRARVGPTERLELVQVDELTGAGAPRSTPIWLDRGGTSPKVVFVAGRFLVFWRPESGARVRFAALGRDGELGIERELSFDGTYGFDVVSIGEHLGVTVVDQGVIRFALLDGEARIVGEPVALSRGVGTSNIDPSITWTGEYFVVSWRTFARNDTFVTIVDRDRRAAPPVALTTDARVAIVADSSGVWAARASEADVQVVPLRCRTTPSDEPPRTIPPAPPRGRADAL